MGIFDLFKSKTITLDDPTFGRLTFRKPSSWEGEVMFLPTGHSVMLFLSGDESGPNVEHRNAFDALVDRYDQLKTEIEKNLVEMYEISARTWMPTITPKAFQNSRPRIRFGAPPHCSPLA